MAGDERMARRPGLRAGIYVHAGPDEPAEPQRARLEEYCRRHRWDVVARESNAPQPRGRRWGRGWMLKRAFDGEFGVIVVERLKSLASNANSLILTLDYARRHGIRVVAVADKIDSGRGAQAARLVEALAAVERETNSRVGWVLPRDPCEGCPVGRPLRGRREGRGTTRRT
jgi:DNA invertase Pin-like site-specific DNA recombinase